jgi:hypothetical protein
MKPTADSLFDRLAIRLCRTRILIPLSLSLILLPITLAFVDGQLDRFFSGSLWRVLLIQPAIIIYILFLSPFMQRAREGVIAGLRPIVQLTDEEFERLVAEESRRHRC